MTRLNVPDHVHESVASHGGSVLLDARSGRCFAMNPVARTLWREWRRGQDFESAVNLLTSRYPAPQHDQIREDARRLADDLIGRGLLTAEGPEPVRDTPDAEPHAETPDTERRAETPKAAGVARAARTPAAAGGSPPHAPGQLPTAAMRMMAAVPVCQGRAGERRSAAATAAGLLGLMVALLLIRLPFGVLVHTVDRAARWRCGREATSREAADALAVVRSAAECYPGRAACLELSLATVAVLALRGRRAVWCVGVAEDPYRFHAWVEAQGVRVIPAGEYEEAGFRRVLSV
ncbi:lasso peptide biosynthesis B2 protein [Streptomyces humidus]|uniref:lasso peptide biosynthesis B2 protein n=1 Tax=Streptomyces humidus TaxID=52259 RepID=UPI00332A2C66